MIETTHLVEEGLVNLHLTEFWYEYQGGSMFGRDTEFTDENHLGQLLERFFESILQEAHTSGTQMTEVAASYPQATVEGDEDYMMDDAADTSGTNVTKETTFRT